MSNTMEVSIAETIEFKWKKARGTTGRNNESQSYESFTYDGMDYTLYDCVYLYKEGESEPYIGKLIKIWESRSKEKKVKILWFFRPSEISSFVEDVETCEDELFLASGEGVGLANVNQLEAIAGKCNVVCTSKDSRNPQPSPEELREADFIFHRTFDVEHCKISDKIDEKIAGIDVKFIFNRKKSPKPANALHLESDKADDDSRNVLIKDGDVKASCTDVDAEKLNATYATEGQVVCHKATLQSKVDFEKIEGKANKILPNQALVEGKVRSPRFVEGCSPVDGSLSSKDDRNQVNSNDVKHGSIKEKVKSPRLDVEDGHITGGKNSLRSKADDDQFEKKINNVRANQALAEASKKSIKDFSALDDRPSEKTKASISHDKGINDVQKFGSDLNDVKALAVNTSTHENTKPKRALDSHDPVNGSSKRPKLVKDTSKPSNDKLVKATRRESPDDGLKNASQSLEVTRRPNSDSSRWYKGPPWKERMRTAHKQGKLVLLQNLDPAYTSAEVEGVLFHGFKESCTAKMIQRTAISSPHCGQAYVVFKTREAAEMVVRKLDEGCLMLPNGRPLVGSICNTDLLEKTPSFVGHLAIDRAKLVVQRAEMKQAVSTSHCSQPNTIEYEMAMEWCLLHKRSDSWWKNLYKTQGHQLRKLKASLKSK